MSRTAIVASFCQGYVLAGGRSSRMGQDKALMQLDGQPLAAIVALNVRGAVGSVTLVGERAKYGALGLPLIEDLHPGLGPLSGIHAALTHCRKPLALIAGCDMPFLTAGFLEELAMIASVGDAEVTVAESLPESSAAHRYESLCAVYNRSALSRVEEAIARDELKLATLYQQLKLRVLSAEECAPYNRQGILFANVNTPDDFEIARRRMQAATCA
jgi:molybdopterin-guanine dinucleotide biosynthesis protein A